MVDT
jgi:hypothetical protein